MSDSVFTYTDADLSLSLADEVATIARARMGDDEATMTLVHAYGPALRSAVRRFASEASAGIELADLQSTALVGFLEVIAEHDPARSPRLAGAVSSHLNRHLSDEFGAVSAFTVPTRTLRRFFGILKGADGDVEAAEKAAPDHGMTRETFRDVLSAVRNTDSLDGLTDDEDGFGAGSAAPVTAPSPIADVEDRILVEVAFGAVEDEEARICELAYGFTEYEPVPDAEIAHRLGLTRPTVQRKRAKALGSMRKALGVTHD